MNRRVFLSAAASGLAAAALPDAGAVKIEQVATVPSYSEGIVFDHEGFAYVSHGRFISRVGPDGTPRVWAETGAPNGHKILGDGTHLVCDGGRRAVLHLDAEGKVLGNAAAECDGQPLRGANDLTLDPAGGFYFTDPGDARSGKPVGRVHHTDARGKVTLVADGFYFPNGIVLRPGGRELLIAESLRNRVLRCDLTSRPARVEEFARLPEKGEGQIDNLPDGMCLDAEGNLYVAHWGMRQVQVVDRAGRVIRRYPGGNLTTSNVAFGGPGRGTLYVTGALGEEKSTPGGLFRMKLAGVTGLGILPERKR